MRPSSNCILTFLPLVILITLSFLTFSAEGSSSDVAARHARHFASRRSLGVRQQGDRQDDDPSDDGTSVSASSSSFSEAPTVSSSSTSSTHPPSVTSTSSTTDSSSSLVSTSSPTSTTTSTSSSFIPSTTRSSTSLTPSSISSFTTSSTITSSSISTSTSSSQILPSSSTTTTTSSSSTRSSSQVTSSTTSSTSTVIIATNVQSRIPSSSSSLSFSSTSIEASSSETASSKGFLSNSGAMAGTFTALGLVVIGIAAAAVLLVRKRKRSEELEIFDTEYKEYFGGNDLGGPGDNGVSDTTSLSANAVSHAGAYNAEPNLNRVDYGLGPPPAVGTGSNRSSVASNHAGYGAFRSAAEQRKPPMQRSNLQTTTTWNSDAAYAEPAVDENQSIHIVPNYDHGTYYTDAVRAPGLSH